MSENNTTHASLSIDSGNAAFTDAPAYEISRLFRQTANKIDAGHTDGPLIDINGNNCGSWFISFECDDCRNTHDSPEEAQQCCAPDAED